MRTRLSLSCAALTAFTSVAQAGPQSQIFALGRLPGAPSSTALGLSRNGAVVVGASGTQAFRWTPQTGMLGLGHLASPFNQGSVALGVSDDGTIVVGCDQNFNVEGFPTWAFRWTAAGGMQPLTARPSSSIGSLAAAISGDGQIIVGDSGNRPVRWNPGGGMQVLIDATGKATAVSADGWTIAGRLAAAGAFRLLGDGSVTMLGDLPGGQTTSWSAGVSSFGNAVVGRSPSSRSGTDMEAFRWTIESGMIPLGDLTGGGYRSEALATTADGTIVVGQSSTAANFNEAFIWDPVHGMRSLRTVLINEYQMDMTGWTLNAATGITPDGLTLCGSGRTPAGQNEAWVARLDHIYPHCPADLNQDGVVNSQDLFDFLVAFFSGTVMADLNHDSVVNTVDFFEFFQIFFGGC